MGITKYIIILISHENKTKILQSLGYWLCCSMANPLKLLLLINASDPRTEIKMIIYMLNGDNLCCYLQPL